MSQTLPAAPNGAGERKSSDEIPIIDTHQHLWDLKRFRLAWLSGDGAKKINRSFLPADYAEATRGLGVVKTVYMEVDVDPAQQQAEAEYVLELCRDKSNPMAGAVISGRPEQEAFAKYIRGFKDQKAIKGVRRLLNPADAKTGLCLGKTFVANVRLLGELGMSFDITIRVGELKDATALIDACPDTRFVLDHCGSITPTAGAKVHEAWRRDLADMARRKNVICKISGIVAGAVEKWTADDLAPSINHCLDTFGPDRVVFGGDWPVCTLRATYRQWVETLRVIVKNRSVEDRRKLWHDNAAKFYGLAGEE